MQAKAANEDHARELQLERDTPLRYQGKSRVASDRIGTGDNPAIAQFLR